MTFQKMAGIVLALVLLSSLAIPAQVVKSQPPPPPPSKKSQVKHANLEELKKKLEMYAQVDITYDEAVLSEPEKTALIKLLHAAHIMDELFLRQVWEGNVAMRDKLKTASKKAVLTGTTLEEIKKAEQIQALYHFFRINFGPWDRINDDEPFIGDMSKPKRATFYPEDMTKEEFETTIKDHPDKADAFKGYFRLIQRDGSGLKAVPYNEEYHDFLYKAAMELKAAADILTDPANTGKYQKGVDYSTLATYLRSRADAFLSNYYLQSDMDWMDVTDNIIDVTIGPYEVYEDNLFGYKAAFEAFIAIRHPEDSKNLEGLKSYTQKLEQNLPIPDEHKNLDRGSESPISVVDLVFSAGDTKAGVQTIAFNLPNDERVRDAKGSKKVMLKNISRAKFDKILIPIAEMMLDPAQLEHVDFDTYFSNTLMHEFAHGLGPGNITLADGTETTVNQELKDLYSFMEEMKADITGLYNTAYMAEEGYFPKEREIRAYVTFLPGFFRAIRFGIHGAHGKANMMQFNFLMEKGGITYDKQMGKFHVNLDKMPQVVKELTTKALMIQALGDYDAAKAFIDRYGKMPPEMEPLLAKLTAIPIDIEPIFAAEKYIGE